jgi:pantoate--beta-alanine ligase
MMEILCDIPTWQETRAEDRAKGLSLGLVPTMGALHQGHLSLVQQANSENDTCLVSLFVNPTQFDQDNDFEQYPQQIEKDLELLKSVGVRYVLLPDQEMMYPDQYRYKVREDSQSTILCGSHRPGHFDGVLTVVLKLLNLAQAEKAYFGEKDYQQLQLVRGMAEAFFIPTEIVGCPLVREEDGLAMSSRNLNLTESERQKAPLFYQILKESASVDEAKKNLSTQGFDVDYVEEHWGRRLGAVRLGQVRLIDNVEL